MATTPYPFQSGAVLTASQLNSTFNIPTTTKTASYTLTAADAGTRIYMNSGSATTITVNTSIFAASDVVEIFNIGAGITTITAGTATVSSAGPLAIPQYGSGRLTFTAAGASIYTPSAVTVSASGLTLVKTQTIGTTVSSVTVTNAFSSTYDVYEITLSGGVASASGNIQFKLDSASNYYWSAMYLNYNTGTFNGDAAQNSTQFNYGFFGNDNNLSGTMIVTNPNLAKRTSFTSASGGAVAGYSFQVAGGFQNANTVHTDFTIQPASGTLTGGTIRVYGLLNS